MQPKRAFYSGIKYSGIYYFTGYVTANSRASPQEWISQNQAASVYFFSFLSFRVSSPLGCLMQPTSIGWIVFFAFIIYKITLFTTKNLAILHNDQNSKGGVSPSARYSAIMAELLLLFALFFFFILVLVVAAAATW